VCGVHFVVFACGHDESYYTLHHTSLARCWLALKTDNKEQKTVLVLVLSPPPVPAEAKKNAKC
jgi:hypothetical protein